MEDARRVACRMPGKLAQQMNTLSYVLLPVSVLDKNGVRRQIRSLDAVLVKKTAEALKCGSAVLLVLEDLLRSAESRDKFPKIQEQIFNFKKVFETASTGFSSAARRLLPKLRDGATDCNAKISELEHAVGTFK
ncbi:hypothetical protein PI124_g14714 [Phytophthora idaei]|nr:hypothetical protein PI125_g22014 [Phytophthora idaei]KAG3130888.1 hypothetical protein PI126_g20294 [Phytophthora idaei]KAG3240383.1 hypothetical protein PI124_g14714 [Phytophthora idaei]